MDYGAEYRRTITEIDDDSVSMLSHEGVPSQYQAYRPNHSRDYSEDSVPDSTYPVSPVTTTRTTHQTISPLAPLPEPCEFPPGAGASLFESRAVLDRPYQTPVAYENAAQFRIEGRDAPKPEQTITDLGTETAAPGSGLGGSGTRRYFRHPRHILEPWTPGFWIRFPWWGIVSLFGVVALTGASAAILAASNDSPVGRWRIGGHSAQPQLFLSIFEMFMNALVAFAFLDGMVIRFWRQMMKGTTLSSIHDTYESALLIPAARRALRLRFNVLATACLLAAISALRGPFFQRASTVSERFAQKVSGMTAIEIAPFPTPDFLQSNNIGKSMTLEISDIVQGVLSGSPIMYNDTTGDCGEYCKAIIKGFGFKADCSTSNQAANVPYAGSIFSTTYETKVAYTPNPQDHALTITSIFKSDASCNGAIQTEICTLSQGTRQYPVAIGNGTIERLSTEEQLGWFDPSTPLDPALMESFWPMIIQYTVPPLTINVTDRNASTIPSPFTKCLRPVEFSAEGGKASDMPTCWDASWTPPELAANDPSVLYATTDLNYTGASAGSLCNLAWTNPNPDIIDKLQSLAFRIMVDMATGNASKVFPSLNVADVENLRKNWTQDIHYEGFKTAAVFKTNAIYLAFGIIFSFLGIAGIIPLYIGWWELGRKFSCSPLEIARAFGAPILEGVDGNASAERIVIERGAMAVRYGALERYGEEKKLRVEETSRATVRTPWRGELFG